MALFVNTNVSSINAQRNLNTSTTALSTSLQRLSSGMRINSSKDDAAGLAVATGMTTQVRGSNQAIRNANDAVSMAQTAEGMLGQVESNVQRMRELAVQGANGTATTANRSQIKLELDQLAAENSRLITNTKFNDQQLFTTGATQTFSFQIGAGTSASNQIDITIKAADFSAGVATTGDAILTFATSDNALSLISSLDTALTNIVTTRASLGAAQNRFSAVVSNLSNYVENVSAAKSRIMDTDFAAETATLTRNQIIQQAGTAMLSQANQLPNAAMSLLR